MRHLRLATFTLLALAPLIPALGCLAIVDADFEGATLVPDDTTTTPVLECEPDTIEPCYSGPQGTQGVGVCHAGTRPCLSDGSGHGECVGQVLPGMECGVDAVDEDCDGRTGAHVWSTVLAGKDVQRVYATAALPDGSSVLTGYTWASLTVGELELGIGTIVVRLGPGGEVLWGKSFGAPLSSSGLSIALDPKGDVILTGTTKSSIDFGGGPLVPPLNTSRDVIAKLDGVTGDHLWSQMIGGGEDDTEDASIAVDPEGNILLGGVYRGTLVWPEGPPLDSGGAAHMYLALLDPDGKHLFSRDYGGNAYPRKVAFDPSGALLVIGNVSGVANLGGEPLGTGPVTSFVARFTPSGDHVWSRVLGTTTENYYGRGVTSLSDGTIVAAVPFYGVLDTGETPLVATGLDVAIVAFNPTGNVLWSSSFGGDGFDSPWAIATTTDDDVVVGGTFEGDLGSGPCPAQSLGEYDAFLLKLDRAGHPLWVHTFGDDKGDGDDPGAAGWPSEIVMALSPGPDGSVIVAGEHDGTVDWGGGPLLALIPGDVVVSRYAR